MLRNVVCSATITFHGSWSVCYGNRLGTKRRQPIMRTHVLPTGRASELLSFLMLRVMFICAHSLSCVLAQCYAPLSSSAARVTLCTKMNHLVVVDTPCTTYISQCFAVKLFWKGLMNSFKINELQRLRYNSTSIHRITGQQLIWIRIAEQNIDAKQTS